MTLTQQEMDEALAVAIAKLEADNTALTAQNEALRTALFAVIDQIERDVENSLNPYGPTAAQAREALSLTPAEALERAKRDAEERRLMGETLKVVSDHAYDAYGSHEERIQGIQKALEAHRKDGQG